MQPWLTLNQQSALSFQVLRLQAYMDVQIFMFLLVWLLLSILTLQFQHEPSLPSHGDPARQSGSEELSSNGGSLSCEQLNSKSPLWVLPGRRAALEHEQGYTPKS